MGRQPQLELLLTEVCCQFAWPWERVGGQIKALLGDWWEQFCSVLVLQHISGAPYGMGLGMREGRADGNVAGSVPSGLCPEERKLSTHELADLSLSPGWWQRVGGKLMLPEKERLKFRVLGGCNNASAGVQCP